LYHYRDGIDSLDKNNTPIPAQKSYYRPLERTLDLSFCRNQAVL